MLSTFSLSIIPNLAILATYTQFGKLESLQLKAIIMLMV
jgi:hypothetical protein